VGVVSGVAAFMRTVQGMGRQLVLFVAYVLARSSGLVVLVLGMVMHALVSLAMSGMFRVLRGVRRPMAAADVLVRRLLITEIVL